MGKQQKMSNGVNKQMKPLPANAKMVFKGIIFEVWQWRQKMFDGSTQTFERLKRPDTVQVIPIVGDKILIQRQEQPDQAEPFFSFPGGRRDDHENPLSAAKRELLEETGCTAKEWHLWKKRRPVSKIEWTVYTYIARHCALKSEPTLDAGEKITNRLITFKEFLQLPDDPSFYDKELAIILIQAQHSEKAAKDLQGLLFGALK